LTSQPYSPNPALATRLPEQTAPDIPFSGQPLRVLLVEDNPDDAFLLERHLQRAGYRSDITRVETEEEMRSELDGETGCCWHVILADYNLPNFSALAALRLLKSTALDIPLIVMSGAISEETAVAAMRAGALDYVAKQNLARLVPAIEREITEADARRVKRAAELALRIAEERFHRLAEAMPLGLFISGESGKILYANEALEKILGYSQEEIASGEVTTARILTGASEPDLSPKPTGECAPDSASGYPTPRSLIEARLWAEGGCEPFEVECIRKDGTNVCTLIGAAILNPEAPKEECQIAAFLVDLTEQKQSHNVLRRTEKLAAAGRLAASIAHEINNPLESVTNCLYLLHQGQMDDSSRKYLDLAQRELDRVVQITTQTLRFYRQNSRPTLTDVHELFATVLTLFDARIRNTEIEVVRKFGHIPTVLANDGEIRQVLANLIGNAIDAMPAGGKLCLRTTTAIDWQDGRKGISITISDSGQGMDRHTRQRIFEPFFSTKGLTGTGLGLWVTQGILAKHQAKITLRSRQGKGSGTTFRLFLPFDSPLSTQGEMPAEHRASTVIGT
jgi:nitrogen-specific signal transduction histidine kinase/CheY-like chemotaxis protein